MLVRASMTGAIIGHRKCRVVNVGCTTEIMTPETVKYSLQDQIATIRIPLHSYRISYRYAELHAILRDTGAAIAEKNN